MSKTVDGTEPSGDTTVTEWAATHDVLPSILPFAYRETEPIDLLATLSDGLDALPATAATFKVSDLLGDAETFARSFGATEHIDTMLALCGSFQCDETSTGKRYSNPHYIHGSVHREPWGSTAERVAFAERMAHLGAVERAAVARHFGVETQTLSWAFDAHDFAWDAHRQAGKARFVRSVETVVEWTGRDYVAVLDPLPVSYSQHRYWRDRFVDDDFEPPADPTTAAGTKRWRPAQIDG